MLLIICEFHENRCKEGRTFHMGVSVNRIRVYRKKIERMRWQVCTALHRHGACFKSMIFKGNLRL